MSFTLTANSLAGDYPMGFNGYNIVCRIGETTRSIDNRTSFEASFYPSDNPTSVLVFNCSAPPEALRPQGLFGAREPLYYDCNAHAKNSGPISRLHTDKSTIRISGVSQGYEQSRCMEIMITGDVRYIDEDPNHWQRP